MDAELASRNLALSLRHFDDASASLAEMGESWLLAELARLAAATARADVELGPGDDAAIVRTVPGLDLVWSQDALVEGEDFRRQWITPYQLGRRALHVALSDLAGMGAAAVGCLATLCAPGATAADDAVAIQAGLCAAAAEVGCAVAGGDLSAIDGPLVIDVNVIGTVPVRHCLSLGSAQPGDLVLVTGVLGRAAAGLQVLLGSSRFAACPPELVETWREAQLQPRARLDEGVALLGSGVSCGTDISDGLTVSAAAICAASGVAIEVWADALPVDQQLRDDPDWLGLAIAAGEDFELLVTAPENIYRDLVPAWPPELAPLTVIGTVGKGSTVDVLDRQGGARLTMPASGSRHFGAPVATRGSAVRYS